MKFKKINEAKMSELHQLAQEYANGGIDKETLRTELEEAFGGDEDFIKYGIEICEEIKTESKISELKLDKEYAKGEIDKKTLMAELEEVFDGDKKNIKHGIEKCEELKDALMERVDAVNNLKGDAAYEVLIDWLLDNEFFDNEEEAAKWWSTSHKNYMRRRVISDDKFKKINETGGEFVPPELFECDGVEYKIEPEKNPTFPEGDYAILEWEDGEYKYKCRHMGAYDVKMWMNNMRRDENRRREERILRQRYKKNESKDGEWVDMDDLIGVPQSDPRDDIESPKRFQKADESNVVVNVNDVWELLKVLEDDDASSNLKSLIDSHVRSEAEIMDAIDELYPENVTQIELNNVFATGMEEIVDALGLDVDAYMKDGSFVDTLKPSTIAAEGDEESNQDEVKDGEKKFKGDDGEVKTLDNADKKVVSEMTIEQEIDDPWKLSEMMWGQGQENLQELLRSDVVDEEEVMQMLEDMGIRDLTGINDVFAFEFPEILESLGLDGKAWSNNLEIKRKDDDDEE